MVNPGHFWLPIFGRSRLSGTKLPRQIATPSSAMDRPLKCALAENRQLAIDALAVLGQDAVLGEAAIYLFAKLPPELQDDNEVVRKLIQEHKVTCIPGSACGVPGHIRVAFANLSTEECRQACKRLHAGLQSLMGNG